jgi:hypothetical protein
MKVINGRRATNTAHHAQKPGRRQKILILFFSGETCTRLTHMMNEAGMIEELHQRGVAAWRIRMGTWIESLPVQKGIIGVIVFNAVILGLETDRALMERAGFWLILLDQLCLALFLVEIGLKYAGFFTL